MGTCIKSFLYKGHFVECAFDRNQMMGWVNVLLVAEGMLTKQIITIIILRCTQLRSPKDSLKLLKTS